MDAANIIALAGGRVGSSKNDIAVEEFLGHPDPIKRDRLDILADMVDDINQNGYGERKDASESDDASRGKTSVNGSTLKFVEVVRCPATRLIDANLLAMAINTDRVVPPPADWDQVEIDHRTGQLCLPPTYVADIKKFYKNTSVSARARLAESANALTSNATLPSGVIRQLKDVVGTMSNDDFNLSRPRPALE